MASTIQLRVDDDLKLKSDALFKELGTDTTSAIRMFLTQAVACNGFPFEIKRVTGNPYAAMTEDEILSKDLAAVKKCVDGYIDAFNDIHDYGEFKHGIRMFYTEYKKLYDKYISDYADYYYSTYKAEHPNGEINNIVYEAKKESLSNPFNASLATKNERMFEHIQLYRQYKNEIIKRFGNKFQEFEYKLKSEEYSEILSSEYNTIQEALDEMADEILKEIDQTVIKDEKQLEDTFAYLNNSIKLDQKLFLGDLFDSASENVLESLKAIKDRKTRNEMANKIYYATSLDELARIQSESSGTRTR
jgi:DNA-damage-inducible protein J